MTSDLIAALEGQSAFDSFSGDTWALLHRAFFKIGGTPITAAFVLKVAVFLVLLSVISHFVQKVLLARVFRHIHVSSAAQYALGRFVGYTLFLGGLFVGLQSLGVNLSSFVIFGGAVGVGVGLGLQNVVSNFVAGIILLIEQPIRIGDRVEVKETLGDVIKIESRSTWIRTNDNYIMIVPNSDFINNAVTNWSVNDEKVRVWLPVGVGYNSSPEQVRSILLEAAAAHPDVMSDPAPDVLFTEYGDNSLNFSLRVWTEKQSHTPKMLKSDLYFDIFRRFTEANIEIPFPQRDLHIRSSDIPLPFPGNNKPQPSAGNSSLQA